MTLKSRVRRRIALAILAVVLIPPLGFFTWRWEDSNFDTIQPERLYRSAQMTAPTLARTIKERKIKTVLNLRGVNVGEAWYRQERAATTTSGATQVDVSMASDQWMSRAQLRAIVRILDTSEYPLLMHCQWGAERTGLISAVSELLREGATLEDARRQFSLYYMFVRIKDGKVMAEHLDLYESWLKAQNRKHSPANFRQWVADGFVPKSPGREDWPYDPYPLLTITRPEPSEPSRKPQDAPAASLPIASKKDLTQDARPR